MAGAFVKIEVDDRDTRRGLQQLLDASIRLRPVFVEIGEQLSEGWRKRFLTQAAPDGTPWAPNNPDYAEQKRAETGSELVLVLTGKLKDLLTYRATARGVEIGSNRKYAATHQFGAPERGIPARPFLGLSRDDENEVLAIMKDHLERDLDRRRNAGLL